MLNIHKTVDTDILIVGGGIGGLMASICAGEQGLSTIVAEKAHVRRSGSGATGNDHFLCFMPEIQNITLKEMINEMLAGQVGPWHDTQLTKVFGADRGNGSPLALVGHRHEALRAGLCIYGACFSGSSAYVHQIRRT